MKQDKMDSGQQRLEELGYRQELKRSMSPVGSVALCFSAISIITGITPTFNTGLTFGGPVSIVYGWLVVCFFTACISLSLAEICSAFPTAGGLYFWSFKLAGKRRGAFMAWTTGWFNIAAMWTAAAAINFTLALLLQTTILVSTGGGNGGGYYASKYVIIALYGAILLLQGLINLLGVRWFSWLGNLAALWNILGVFVIGVLLLVLLPRRSASSVFTSFNVSNDAGIHSKPYIFLLGLLMSQYTLLGYDTAAHLAEETKSSDKSSGYSIVIAAFGAMILGFFYLLPLVFTSVDVPHLLDPNNDTKGYAIAQLLYDGFQHHRHDPRWSSIVLLIPCGLFFCCGLFVVTAGSRMAFAFSRDGALPFSSFWHRLNKREVPVYTVALGVIIPFCLGLPYLASTVAFQATLSIATISISITYMFPILLRVTIARRTFVPGPLNLGRYSIIVGWTAVCWILTFTVLFCLPVVYPITLEALNYTPVALVGFTIFVFANWYLNGRFWFEGPVPNIPPTLTQSQTNS